MQQRPNLSPHAATLSTFPNRNNVAKNTTAPKARLPSGLQAVIMKVHRPKSREAGAVDDRRSIDGQPTRTHGTGKVSRRTMTGG
ncbi:hypothetical protein BDN70DRAFT_887128 [Pholiota conissans]|uniref:Uncharacterized protein n=1 Tax=Pholiota conissans TaxID=109636 RepID=A0A9P5YPG4_9AGAR|nr:hypothetical protein BDN70DRAFT_887128 [Pholiota conissans]